MTETLTKERTAKVSKSKPMQMQPEASAVSVPATTTPTTAVTIPAKKVYYVKKLKGAFGFRKGCCLELLALEGSKDFITKEELVAKVAKILGKPEARVMSDLATTMPYPNHPNNKGRATIVKDGNKIKVVPA